MYKPGRILFARRLLMAVMASIALPSAAFAQSATAKPLATNAGDDQDADSSAIVVTATRSGDAISTRLLGSSVTVIDAAALENRQTRIISDVLRDVPGLAVSRTGAIGGLTQVRVRGAEGNHVLVLIDGIKASDAYAGEYDFGTLIADDAARIEVLRGQQSSLYGSDAIGGVINYITLSGAELPGLRMRAEGGSFGTYAGSARAAGVTGTLDYALSASLYNTDGYPVARNGSRDVGSDSFGASAKATWAPIADFKVTAVGRYSRTRADTDNSSQVSGPLFGYTVDSPGVYFRNDAYYGLLRAELTSLDGKWTNAVSGQIADTKRDGYSPSGRTSGNKGTRYRGSFESTLRFGSDAIRHRLTAAVDAEREVYQNTSPPSAFAFTGKRHADQVGIVGQYDVTIADRLALGASLRHDENQRFRDNTTYRVQGSYAFDMGLRIHAASGSGVKNPGFYELYGYSDGKFIGNPNLKPERSQGWEAGIEQRALGGRITLGATYFDNRFKDEIYVTYPAPLFVPSPANRTTSSKQRGVELSAQAKLPDGWRLDASYTYLDAPQLRTVLIGGRLTNFDGQAVRRARSIASANLTWAPPALPVEATLTVRYNGSQKDLAFTDPSFTPVLVTEKSFTLVNFNASYQLTRRLSLFGRVENLFDEKYEEIFSFATPGRAGYAGIRVAL
jgi:vitamin B12 transporter